MTDEQSRSPEDEFREMLNQFLSGNSSIDPAQLAGAAGLPNDPASLAALMAQLQNAVSMAGEGVNWNVALTQAEARASQGERQIEPSERSSLEQAAHVANLWLDEATAFETTGSETRQMTRGQWARATIPVWTELATPVATSISDALTNVLNSEAPEEMRGALAGASGFLRSIGGSLFAMQLGNVVGQLSSEVVAGGDIGIPLLAEGESALLPQNIDEFGKDLDVPIEEVRLYLATREIAHARLFKHARWLRLHVISALRDFAHGVHIDMSRLQDLAEDFDPSNPEELRRALSEGSLIPPKTETQIAALTRLETILALIEGWVDAVTESATQRLPKTHALAETIRRRRASGGPAESAFGSLVGLELRPRRLREAAAMWKHIGQELGVARRDELWSHPDVMPDATDIDNPDALIARLSGTATPSAEDVAFDEALDELLRGDLPPHEDN